MAWQEHQTIWLEPWCEKCEADVDFTRLGRRQWSHHRDDFAPCDLCERRPVQYEVSLKTAQGKSDD